MEDIIVIIKKLEKIESEVIRLKKTIKNKQQPLKLGGIWAGIEVSAEDFESAKKSLFKITQTMEQ